MPLDQSAVYYDTTSHYDQHQQQQQYTSRMSYENDSPRPVTSVARLALSVQHTPSVLKLPPSARRPGRLVPSHYFSICCCAPRVVPGK